MPAFVQMEKNRITNDNNNTDNHRKWIDTRQGRRIDTRRTPVQLVAPNIVPIDEFSISSKNSNRGPNNRSVYKRIELSEKQREKQKKVNNSCERIGNGNEW